MDIATRLARSLLVVVLVVTALVLVAGVVAAIKVALYEQRDDTDHLEQKQAYLARLREASAQGAVRKPNIVFVLYDDLGYGDFSFTGSRAIDTPNIDALAHEGARFTRFYSPAPVCTPSRFGFLTGRFAERAGLSHVVFPQRHPLTWMMKLRGRNIRMPAHEITLAEMLGAAGYRTGMVGKWHLGDHSPSLPNDLGFDEFFGALYSNDMQPFAFYRNRAIVERAPVDQTRMSERYEHEAVAFIERNADQPFFLYLAHNFPHLPLHARDARKGRSRGGLYGDVVEELDEGLGRIVTALEAEDVLDDTLIIVTSDNGPWFQGDPGPVRGRKGETFEGGMHVPLVIHWPRGGCRGCALDGLAMGTDLVPTVLDILDLPAPSDRVLDGRSLLPMLSASGPGPHEYLYYFSGALHAVRDDRFKYMPRRAIGYPTAGDSVSFGLPQAPWLFDLATDPAESYDTSDRHAEHFARLGRAHADMAHAIERDRFGLRDR